MKRKAWGCRGYWCSKLARVYPPIAQTTITSPFGPRWGTIHKGIDYSCQDGVTAIASSKSGVVELAKFGEGGSGFGGYGNVVVINHGNGYWSLYGHMSSITVQEGQNIESASKSVFAERQGKLQDRTYILVRHVST